MKPLEIARAEIEKGEEKLNAAAYLRKGGFYEDAVSRAYYSMFHCAKAVLAIKNIDARTHKGVTRMFGLHVVKADDVEEYYGKALRFAKEVREKSDYDIFAEISKEETETVIQDAERFYKRIVEFVDEIEKRE